MQAVDQVLRRMLPANDVTRKRMAASPQSVWKAVMAAADPFISTHAAIFSDNLLSFLAFRGTLSAWDNACLRQQVQAQRHVAQVHKHSGASRSCGFECSM